jgi:protoporphyrinogen oxidase
LKGPVVILGAGPAGLGAAYLLHRSGFQEWTLYEREATVGGLSRSIKDDRGFTWDLGGHVVFSHYDEFTNLLDELLGVEGWLDHERECWVRILDRWVPYPFQNNIRYLPPEECAQCLEGLIRAAIDHATRRGANFDEFIEATFGRGIAELFMRPYNFKVWAYKPAKLSTGWIGERVAVPDPIRIARNIILGKDDLSWGPNNRFRFPKSGGTGAIWQAAADRLPANRVVLSAEAVELDVEARTLRFSNGASQRYGTLISTIPLDQLACLARRQDWMNAARNLLHSAVHVVGVALAGSASSAVGAKCWMYFPEDRVPFYRVTHFSHYSPHNVDDIRQHWSLLAEISESPDKAVNSATVVGEAVRGLVNAGLIEAEHQVLHTWTQRIDYAYPTPSLGRDTIVHSLLPALEEKGILSRGRFGAWLYEVGNMDHSFMQGMEAADYALRNVPERTLQNPDEVNRPLR